MKQFLRKSFTLFSFFVLLCLVLLPGLHNVARAQCDTCKKNTVRINITNPLIFGDKAIVLGYERVLKNNKSMSVNIGRAYFPKILPSFKDSILDSIPSLTNEVKEFGFNMSLDYRIYLKKENKYGAPRGVYIGPYASYNYFSRTNQWSIQTGGADASIQTNLNVNIVSVGFELGYQFVLWDRLSVDMILAGPGVAFYDFKVGFNTSLSDVDEAKFYDKLNNYLSDKFPGYEFAVDDVDFQKKGHSSTTSLGYRYMIMVGYRF